MEKIVTFQRRLFRRIMMNNKKFMTGWVLDKKRRKMINMMIMAGWVKEKRRRKMIMAGGALEKRRRKMTQPIIRNLPKI